jgi:hypothetical protein
MDWTLPQAGKESVAGFGEHSHGLIDSRPGTFGMIA